MTELEGYRAAIDEIDAELVRLFLRRMEVTAQVGAYKKERGLPVLDAARERQVIAAKAAQTGDPARKADVAALYESIMAISRRQQEQMMKETAPLGQLETALAGARAPLKAPRVLYQGVEGAYTEEAAACFFGEDCPRRGVEQWEQVFELLRDGGADYGVLPIENSSTGSITQVYDLLAKYGHYIVGEQVVKVEHCLAALPGARLSDIREVYSHEQGLRQCGDYLKKRPGWERKVRLNTAEAAQFVAEGGDLTRAAICSRRAAGLYGLSVLEENISDSADNYTRFVVVSPVMELREGANKISALFIIPHRAGSLHEIMAVFAVNGLSMTKLESRPIPGREWEYRFFVDFTGSLAASDMNQILREVGQLAADFRILGNFKGCER